jgi:2-methylcitrate dehydratase PrpD
MTIASTLAEFATGTRLADLPPIALERAQMSLASTIASAAMGYEIESARIVRAVEKDSGGVHEATVWFDGGKLPAAGAARLNALASDAAASDDSDLRNIAHIGTIVSATAVAMAERLGRSGREALGAMVMGYEIAGRIDEALTPGRMQKGFHGCVSTVFGGAVASGLLLRLSAEQMTHAISIAATSVGGLVVAANTSWAREYHAGLAASLGIQAAMAAARGFIAEPAILEASQGFFMVMGGQDLEAVTSGFGESWDIVTNMAIKLAPGGHPNHVIAEAAASAAMQGNVDPENVADIRISAAQLQAQSRREVRPRDLIGAAHSVVYFAAAGVADRRFGWEHATDAKINDPVIGLLQDKVSFDPNPPPRPDRFGHHHGGTVTITMKDGTSFSNTCEAPRGSGPRGVEWADVDAKYRHLVPISTLDGSKIEESLQVLHRLDELQSLEQLTRLLHL